MTCETVKPLLSDFADDTLTAATSWQVQMHLAECADCDKMSRDLRAVRQLLSALPTRQPSAQFQASLAQRLALTRKPQKRQQTWRDWVSAALGSPRPLFRPALALGVAVTTAGAFLLLPMPTPPAPVPIAVAHPLDPAFIADCVAQHRRDAAGEPLADMAAQNLAGHLDNAGSAAPEAGADAGLF